MTDSSNFNIDAIDIESIDDIKHDLYCALERLSMGTSVIKANTPEYSKLKSLIDQVEDFRNSIVVCSK